MADVQMNGTGLHSGTSLQSTNVVTSALGCLRSFHNLCCESRDLADIGGDAETQLIVELVDTLITTIHSNWTLMVDELPEHESFYEVASKSKPGTVGEELSHKFAYLLSLVYFHLNDTRSACEWAILTGPILSQAAHYGNVDSSESATHRIYRRKVTAGLVERFTYDTAIQSDAMRGFFVRDLITSTLEMAENETDMNAQRSIILMVYGITMQSQNIDWLITTITRFPTHLIFLLNHHIRKVSALPRVWEDIEAYRSIKDPSNIHESFPVKTLKVMVDAAAVLTDNLTGLQSIPYTDYDFMSIRGAHKPIAPITEEDRNFINAHKGASRIESIQKLKPVVLGLIAEADRADAEANCSSKRSSNRSSTGDNASPIADDSSKAVTDSDAPVADRAESPSPSSLDVPDTDVIDEDEIAKRNAEEEEYAKAYQLNTKAILFIQPLIEVWDALVYLWDVKRLNKMLVNLLAGKACWISGVVSSEGRILALQLILDLVVYENPRLARMLAAGQEQFPFKLRESNKNILRRIYFCLSGRVSSHLRLEVLSRFTRAELKLLDQLRQTANGSESIVHQGLMLCHGIITGGTTSDLFLRHNVDWYKRAVCWAKFTGASTLGLTHRGHTENSKSSGLPRSLTILRNYLPPTPNVLPNGEPLAGGSSGGSYSEGGGLYAVGLIHACSPNDTIKAMFIHHLLNVPEPPAGQPPANNQDDGLSSSRSDPVHHGSALALGLVYASTGDQEVTENLKDALMKDNSSIGEAAALAIGMVNANNANEDIKDMLIEYANETHHQKIQRSCGMGVAFLYIDRNNDADDAIVELLSSHNAYIRMCGVWTLAAAFAATGCTDAVGKCLDLCVDDPSDDVRRVAVLALGFILAGNKHRESLCSTVALLMDSYNPHVRYGAAMALGIGAASSGDIRTLGLLRPLAEDATSFVRHGALIALGFVLCSVSDGQDKMASDIRADFLNVVKTKQEDPMVRFAGLLAIGLANAGGGNVSISLTHGAPRGAASTPAVHLNTTSCLGLMLFCNYWYWFPLINCITLSMTNIVSSGLTYRLQIPHDYCVWDTNTRASFDYPTPTPDAAPRKSKRKQQPLIKKRMLRRIGKNKKAAEETSVIKEAETEVEKKAAEEKAKQEEADKLNNTPGFWQSIPARISETRAKGITSGADRIIKAPPAFTADQIDKMSKSSSSRPPVMDSGCVKNEVPHARYIPIIHKRHEGLVVLLDRWSELRMPILSNVVVAMESKKKTTTTATKPVTDAAVDGEALVAPETVDETPVDVAETAVERKDTDIPREDDQTQAEEAD